MNIKRELIKRQTLEQFADEHGLTLLVRESTDPSYPRFHAVFLNVEEVDDCMLITSSGDGDTEQEAIEAYARRLDGKHLAIDAMRKTRRDVRFHLAKAEAPK